MTLQSIAYVFVMGMVVFLATTLTWIDKWAHWFDKRKKSKKKKRKHRLKTF